jgi:hypothetical protein
MTAASPCVTSSTIADRDALACRNGTSTMLTPLN